MFNIRQYKPRALAAQRRIVLGTLFPITSAACELFHLPRGQMERFLVQENNRMVLRELKTKPNRILLLMPHCLQYSGCKWRITGKESHCKRCGKCVLTGLSELAEKYHAKLAIATGGNMARTIVEDYRPDFIIATACERDLASGLKDTVAIPTFGILNERPHGPCFDTTVDVQKIERLLQSLQQL